MNVRAMFVPLFLTYDVQREQDPDVPRGSHKSSTKGLVFVKSFTKGVLSPLVVSGSFGPRKWFHLLLQTRKKGVEKITFLGKPHVLWAQLWNLKRFYGSRDVLLSSGRLASGLSAHGGCPMYGANA